MSSFKGFDDWIAIFKGGKQTDSLGREHDGDAVIKKALTSFNAKDHEPPVVIGHPKDNSPAFGWVSGLKEEGGVLMAKFKDVQNEFGDMVKDGRFKKRSASFYRDGRLRHVGFLGAAPPAVKGLPDVAFADDDSLVFEFSSHADNKFSTVGDVFRRLREFMIEKFDRKAADSVVDGFDIDLLTRPEPEAAVEESFKEPVTQEEEKSDMSPVTQDLGKVRTEAAEVERAKLETEFAEKEKSFQERIDALEKEIQDGKTQEHAIRVKQFIESKKKEGKFPPVWEKMGLASFVESLEHDEALNFSEDKKQTPLDFMLGFIDSLPKVVDFDEISGGDEDSGSDELETLVADYAENNKVDLKTATMEVAKKRPELFEI